MCETFPGTNRSGVGIIVMIALVELYIYSMLCKMLRLDRRRSKYRSKFYNYDQEYVIAEVCANTQ